MDDSPGGPALAAGVTYGLVEGVPVRWQHHGMHPGQAQVLAPHNGAWWVADVLDQYRGRDGAWRVVVRFTTEPGSTYVLAMPADQCRPLAAPSPET